MSTTKAVSILDEPGTRRIEFTDADGSVAYRLDPSPNNRITVYLPELQDPGSGKADQTVSVIINGSTTLIKRGEYVDIPFNVYQVLRNSGQYPNL